MSRTFPEHSPPSYNSLTPLHRELCSAEGSLTASNSARLLIGFATRKHLAVELVITAKLDQSNS